MITALFFWYVGFWISVSALGLDGDGVDKRDIMLSLFYPAIVIALAVVMVRIMVFEEA